ncbi:MAG: SET domain-containing protein, partial [Candidatus Paceibacterota bacterium]
MLHIQYQLKESLLHGIGVFSKERIKAGFCVVEASPLLDINLSEEKFLLLSSEEQKEVRHHGHFDKVLNKWHVDFDMTRFANHSENPNLQQLYNEKGYYIVALRDIEKDEELTINYSDFKGNLNT